ncbi:acyl-CoA desaturase [Moraxella osloensis]|uniref:Acyl-CoA desaturase n=2 Tax=Moraxellaceae TaxID=468 RepID=A0AAD0AD30_FAUOS|nr:MULTISPECIES: fatty acid desaturase [Moraxella]EEV22812.1 stearoyl-CoA 9-desaturase [Enhydrobacter aerosaccus SK60]ATQ83004.1 acyl-CoA desaturase [Moraxella osloensis]ATW85504.1 acyl-CoA desaturase [Moraxella osloensis]MCG8147276.1 fatty acid desaturase [Moraxella tetraodonis]MDK1669767.1 fatty acid desaturase [Moraxella osloensis]
MAQPQSFENAPINWIPAFVLISTPLAALLIVPYYLWTHSVSWQVWAIFAFFMAWNGLSITVGYHRLWSHRTYQAHPIVKWFLLIGGTLAVQGSVFDWCAGHRLHHRHVDDIYQDPYSAKRGFWFSHIGWMLKNYPSGHYDYKNIPDLKADPVLVAQDKYYALWILLANIGLPALFGWMVGDIAGTLVLAGLLRLVLSHHFTFFINSLCHMFGTRPYTDTNTARDNPILAIFTWGEGYHNYHHFFQYDYRNGVKWWQYDPSKWIIYGLSKIGLTWDLKRVPDVTIQHAQTEMAFKRAEKKVATFSGNLTSDFQVIKDRLNSEQQAFKQTIAEWQALKTQAIEMKKNEFAQRIHEVDDKLKDQFSGIEDKLRNHAQQIENLVNHLKGKHV